MKRLHPRSLVALLLFASATSFFAGDVKSLIIPASSTQMIHHVPDEHFIRIYNFTQEGGSMRGLVNVTTSTGMANVLAATIIDPTSATLEVINSVVIAGPADITVTCGGTACFVSFKRDRDD